MPVKVQQSGIEGVLVLTPDCFRDDRGFFMESYNHKVYKEVGIDVEFVQDNHSRSGLHVLRGLHYQESAAPFARLIRCTRGAVLDVAVDLRLGGPTFGRWVAIELSEANLKQLFIPTGFAHGFISLSHENDVEYKTSSYYTPSAEGTIRWDDA